MSFEGEFDYLCPAGHLWHQDAHDTRTPECPWCGETPKFFHLQDHTNCEPVRLIYEPVGTDTCPCQTCHGTGKVEVTRYRVPQEGELLRAEQWGENWKWRPVEPTPAKPFR